MVKVALIGGGVSSVTVALSLNKNFRVTIFERDEMLLKKLRRTGNGRANIFNRNMQASFYNDELFIKEHLSQLIPLLEAFFNKQKILTYTDEAGRVYPYSESAKVLRDNLLSNLNANVRLNTNITAIKKEGEKFSVNGELFDVVLIATGSSAGLKNIPLDNGNARLFKSLALSATPFVPVIKTLAIKEDVSSLQNIRVKASLSLRENGETIHTETGELMFKKDGLSGIVSFIVSSYFEWAKQRRKESTYQVAINLMPEYTKTEVEALLKRNNLSSFFDERLVAYLTKKGTLDIAETITNLTLNLVSGNNPENTQAVTGGVKLSLINKASFATLNDPKLFVLGEALNIDGISGGYNLAFAFYSALVAAKTLNDTFCQ